MSQIKFYNYFRSSASWRVRIALALKNIQYEYISVHLGQSEQLKDSFASVNPLKQVPAIELDGHLLTQSLPIIEYLDETRPDGVKLLPTDAHLRAKARAIAEVVNSGIQPLQNLATLRMFEEPKKTEWARHFIEVGFDGLEKQLAETAGRFCVGDQVTIADMCLVPQYANAKRFGCEEPEKRWPRIAGIVAECAKLPAFQHAHPANQPDCPADMKGQYDKF